MNAKSVFLVAALTAAGPTFALTNITWSPWIQHECRAQMRSVGTYDWPFGSDCTYGPTPITTNHWMISATHEDTSFSGGGLDDLEVAVDPNDPNYATKKHPAGTVNYVRRTDNTALYEAQISVDKVNFGHISDKTGRDIRNGYTTTYVNHVPGVLNNLPPYNLGQDINVYIEVDLKQIERVNWGNIGNAEVRFVLGAAAIWNGKNHFVEINLFRTPGFDHCTSSIWEPFGVEMRQHYGTSQCEGTGEQGKYDHRYYDVGSGTELVYYAGGGVPLPIITESLAQGFVGMHIPIATLFRNYNWTNPPSGGWGAVDQNNVGYYFGIEILGRGRAWFNIRTFNIYRN